MIVQVVEFVKTLVTHVTLVFSFIKMITLDVVLENGLDLVLLRTKVTGEFRLLSRGVNPFFVSVERTLPGKGFTALITIVFPV